MLPSDIVNAIADGNHDIDSIATALGVNHTNATLRKNLKILVATGAVVRSRCGTWTVDGHSTYRFDINSGRAVL